MSCFAWAVRGVWSGVTEVWVLRLF